MNLKPMGNRVLVKRTEPLDVSKGGIIIPEQAKKKSREGTVIAIGDGKELESGEIKPLTLKVNDMVLFAEYSGTDIMVDKEDCVIMDETEVLAKVG
jgi:chaperonin GroES